MYIRQVLFVLGALLSLLGPAHAEENSSQPADTTTQLTQTQPPPAGWLRMISPSENAELTVKRPSIKGEFSFPVRQDTLLIVLDGVDVTTFAAVTDKGFSYKPLLALPAGTHSLSVTAKGIDGATLQKTASFSTRHSELFEEAVMNNDLSLLYEGDLGRRNAPSSLPTTKIESNFATESRLKSKDWLLSLASNIRYMDQNTPIMAPMKNGFNLANWLLSVRYTHDLLNFQGNLGDVQVNETPYTVSNLSRRGAVFTVGYDRYQLRFFDVASEQLFGFRGGAGVGTETDNHIMGLTGGIKLFENRLEARTTYITGGEQGTSFNIGAPAAAKQGTVLGFLVTSDFFSNMARTELESTFSTFTPDTVHNPDRKGSQAYRAKLGGAVNVFNYEIHYERIGTDFISIGNLTGLQKDKAGVAARAGVALPTHNLNLTFTRYNDNVKGDPLLARIYNYQGGIDYSNSWLPLLPFGFSYQKNRQESGNEPAGAQQLSMDTDSVTGRIGFSGNDLKVNFMTAYSRQNDRTVADKGNSSLTYTLNPMYTMQNISVSSNLQLNTGKDFQTGSITDTYTTGLDFRSKWLQEKVSLDLGGTYTYASNDSSTTNNRSINANARIAYQIRNLFGFFTPTLGLRGTYSWQSDHINPVANREEYALFCVLTAAVPFSL